MILSILFTVELAGQLDQCGQGLMSFGWLKHAQSQWELVREVCSHFWKVKQLLLGIILCPYAYKQSHCRFTMQYGAPIKCWPRGGLHNS